MLDTFRKRENLRGTTPNQPGSRAPGTVHTPSPSPAAPRGESPLVKPVLLDPAPAPVTGTTPEPSASTTPASAAAATTPAPLAEAAQESPASTARLIVGPGIKLKGADITDCDTIIVEGEVDASMDSRVVEIAEQGVFRGKVEVDIAEIRGHFEGELIAHKRLVIRETGRASGKIRYGKVCIDEGGELSGDIAAAESDSQRGSTRSLELHAGREGAATGSTAGASK